MLLTQKIRLKASKIKKLFRPLYRLGAHGAILYPARIFNHRSFSVQPKYSKLHIYMCYYLFKHCAKLHEFNLSFSNNYFTFACEIGSQQPLIARMSRMSNHRSFTVKPKYPKLHIYIYVCYYFFKRCAKLHQFILTVIFSFGGERVGVAAALWCVLTPKHFRTS